MDIFDTNISRMETVRDFVNFFKIINRKAKMKLEIGKVTFRIKDTWDLDHIRELLEQSRPSGIVFEIYTNLRWYECLFNKVQVDDKLVQPYRPGFDAIRKFEQQ